MSRLPAKRGVRKVGISSRTTSPSKKSKPSSQKSAAKPWTRKVDNKMRGAYGKTDFQKKVITVNKNAGKRDPLYKRPVNKGAKAYPDLLGTIVHEEYHRTHPKATEKTTRKMERKIVASMTTGQKKRMYGRFQKKSSR